MADWRDEETNEPLIADHRDFYKVEKWTRDGAKVERMLYAGSNLDNRARYSRRQSTTGRVSGGPSDSGRACWTSGRAE
jgi:hypothetical protein